LELELITSTSLIYYNVVFFINGPVIIDGLIDKP